MDKEEKARRKNKMEATKLKPIRPTEVVFQSLDELKKFVEYANSREKTDNEVLNQVRAELKLHKRSPRRKKD